MLFRSMTCMIGIMYMKLMKVPFLLNADGGFVEEFERKWKYRIKKLFISSASSWLSTGKGTNEYLKHYGAIEEKIYIYPFSSVSEKDIRKEVISEHERYEMKTKIGIKSKYMILSIGRFIYGKGFDILLESCSRIQQSVDIYIIGGIITAEYQGMIDKFGMNNVYFIEHIKKEKLQEYYIASDIFILPTRKDVWGLVINEALAKGIPIITTNKCLAGLELIADGENGYIVKSEDIDDLHEKMNELLQAKTLRTYMSINNIEKSKKYTIESMAIKTFQILNCIEYI